MEYHTSMPTKSRMHSCQGLHMNVQMHICINATSISVYECIECTYIIHLHNYSHALVMIIQVQTQA